MNRGLTDIDVIRNRIGQYAFFQDSRRLDDMAGLFHADATLKLNMQPDELRGRAAIRDWLAPILGNAVNPKGFDGKTDENRGYHVLFNHIIEFEDTAEDLTRATATADYFSLNVDRNPATNHAPLPLAVCSFFTCGRFRFWFEKRDGDWRYARLEIDLFAGD